MTAQKQQHTPMVPDIIYKRTQSSPSRPHQAIKSFKVGGLLGKGGFGVCYRAAEVGSGREVAVKIISKSSASMRKAGSMSRLRNEIAIMKDLRHPHIIKLMDSFEDAENYYLILEICEKISLTKVIKERNSLTEPEVRYFIRQLVEALIYVKAKRVIHRDVKGCNILLDRHLALKLADFGLATYEHIQSPNRNNMCGTPNYMAPQIIKKIRYCYQVDIWAAGIVTFVALFNRCPFADQDTRQTYRKIEALEYSLPLEKTISRTAEDFIKRILTLDPSTRMTSEQAIDHPFLTEQVPKFLPEYCCKKHPKALEKINHSPYAHLQSRQIVNEELIPMKITQVGARRKTVNPYSPIPARDVCLVREQDKQPTQEAIQQTLKRGGHQLGSDGHLSEEKPNGDLSEDEHSGPGSKERIKEKNSEPGSKEGAQNQHNGPESKEAHNQHNRSEFKERSKEKHNGPGSKEGDKEKPLWEWIGENLGGPFVVDFVNKGELGFCYMTSSKVRGVRFNDMSTMVLDEGRGEVLYLRKHKPIDQIVKELNIEYPAPNFLQPVAHDPACTQYFFTPEEAAQKYAILDQYRTSYPFTLPAGYSPPSTHLLNPNKNTHNIRIDHILDPPINHEGIHKKGLEGPERVKLECLRHWAVVRKSGKLVYLTVLKGVMQIFFGDGAILYVKKKPLKILFVKGPERSVFREPLDLEKESPCMQMRFQMLEYFLSYLLRKERKRRV